ncbi:MAG: CHAT domain-containing protein, partial [Terriglobia bacterium]
SMNAIAVAYDLMGQRERALAEYEAALKQARRTSSSRLVAFLAANIAGERLEMGRYALAEQGLKRALAEEKSPYLQAYRLGQLSQAEFGMGHYQSSADFATRALRLQAADRDETLQIFYWRARSEQKLGRARAALADINSSLQILEHIRSQLAPDDSMKQHFTDRSGFLYDFAIALNYQLGKKREALAIAEAGRARASEDLLASRNTHPQPKERKTIAATGALVARAEHGTQSSGRAAARLTLRGAAPRGPTRRSAKAERLDGGEPHLQSFASTQPFSVTQMVAAARQMRSTILSYWTGERATYIWVVKADGSIGSARVGVSRARLEALIRKLWPQLRLETKGRSMPRAAQGSALRVAPGVGRIGSLVGRGGDELTFGLADKRNWRELYGLLIRPVAKYLPQTGSLLTLEPHGPLLLLPFAALMNERGQYLIERFRMNYLPSLSLFPYVEQQEKRATKLKPYFLLIADPDRVAPDPLGEPLPALPGARREVAKIAHRLPAREVTLLVGRRAQERRVDRDLPNATVIHFATHAIFDNRSPSESYLALGAGGVDTGTQGRLTAAHVYSLHLHADLVFLSACRTGMGEVSGDGVAGLTRAFFYAGAASLVASLWDVSDETTVRLVPDFYRYWLQDHDKSQALREAQLHLLRDLRAGRIRMRTPYGRYALPEDPVLWASFVLEGEP